MTLVIAPATPEDSAWAEVYWTERWGSARVVTRGQIYDARTLPAFVAWLGDQRAGIATYRIDETACELVTLDAIIEGQGVGSALIDAVANTARLSGCRRLWLITSNDNLDALRFYQRRGLHISAIYPNAIDEARKLKPEIPQIGDHEIPIRDEIELELLL